MREAVAVRKARTADVAEIVDLVNAYAAEDVLLPRTAAEIALAVDDYFVATDAHGRLLACAALREYSPSLAELVSVAVAREAHGCGLGRRVVAAVEELAWRRGFSELFAHSLTPRFFEAIGYAVVERACYPEKRGRAATTCLRRALAGAAPAARPRLAA